jgi:hypothetical protein
MFVFLIKKYKRKMKEKDNFFFHDLPFLENTLKNQEN